VSLGTIVVDLLARTGSFETDTKRAAKIAQQRAKEIDEAFAKAGKAIGVALAAGVTAAGYAFKQTVDRMDELSKAAARASMPTEDFSRLAYAADLADVSMQDLQGAMGKLAKAQGDASRGVTEQVRAFDALGIAYKNADGSLRNTQDVFFDFADKFEDFQGTPEIVALGMQVFGRSFQNLIPLLKDGSRGLKEAGAEADAFGVTVSTQAGQQAEAFNDNLTRLTKTVEGFKIELFSGLIPQLDNLVTRLLAAGRAADGFWKSFAVWASVSGEDERKPGEAIKRIENDLAGLRKLRDELDPSKGLANKLNDWVFGDVGDLDKQIAAQEARLQYLRLLYDKEVNADMAAIGGSTPPPVIRPPKITTTGRSGKAKAPDMTPIDMTDEQRTLLAAIGLYEDIEKRAKDYGLTLEWLDKLYFDGAISTQQYDAATKQLGRTTTKVGEDGLASLRQFSEGWLDQIDPMRAFIREVEKVDQAVKQGFLSKETAEEIKKRIAETFGPKSEIDEFALQAARNIQDALGDNLFDILDGKFDNIGRSFGNLMKRMAAEALAAQLAQQMFGDFAKSGKVGGWLGTALSAVGSMFGGGKASGGPVSAGTTYLVGERGPELFTPQTSGAIVPNHAMGGVTINSTVNAAPGTNPAQLKAYLDQRDAQLKADLLDGMRRGRYAVPA
jgi:hypothetical protein